MQLNSPSFESGAVSVRTVMRRQATHVFFGRSFVPRRLARAAVLALVASGATFAEPPVELTDVAAGTGGFIINGIDPSDTSGRSVSLAGDVNGDGLDDIIVGADGADPGGDSAAGECYVVFGKTSTAPVDLASIAAGTGGFVINGIDAGDQAGESVSRAGDVNGDGLDDLIVGALFADPLGDSGAGESYVIFGKASTTPVDLASVAAGTGGFIINGIDANDESGESVSGAGDVNGDGLDDLIVGARFADPGGDNSAGESYVVFGKTNTVAVDLASITAGTGGFVINGIDALNSAGASVAGAGDVNGDGLADLVVGAPGASPAGKTYVVFGKSSTTPVELATIASGVGGFVINGFWPNDASGANVSSAGDVNGDGLADVVIGTPVADSIIEGPGGQAYVVFGKTDTSPVQLSEASGSYGGFTIRASVTFDQVGASVSLAGDVNGDGLGDVIVGSPGGDPNGDSGAGQSYVVFGRTSTNTIFLSTIAAGNGGFVIKGIDPSDSSGTSVSGGGDVNGDGLDDVVVGATGADPGGDSNAGESYVVFAPPPSCGPWPAVQARLTTGASGSFTGAPQSFSHTRGVDVTVLGAFNQSVGAMKLEGLFVTAASATVFARIYRTDSASLIASGSTIVSSGSNQSVIIPISATLIADIDYRVCVFIGESGTDGTMFDPAPVSLGGFPYTELSGRWRVNQAYSIGPDTFPTSDNIFVPLMTITSTSACAGDFDASGDVGFGDLTVLLLHWGACPANCPWDLDGSGDVGFGDLTSLLLGWG